MKTTKEILSKAKQVVSYAISMSEETKNTVLNAMANALIEHTDDILLANKKDIDAVTGTMNPVMIDRLKLDKSRIDGMAKGIRDVTKLSDPTGKILERIIRPNGLIIEKVSVPMGVVAMIYESRPNVTSDAAALCLKSGNVSVLRSGKEAFRTSFEIVKAMREGLRDNGLPEELINIIEDTSRASANELMTAKGYVDLLIPRGGAGLINACVTNAEVPCIETGTGICHVFVDSSADIDMAVEIINNAKTSRPSVCNAEEVLLVHRDIAEPLLKKLYNKIVTDRTNSGLIPVEIRGDREVSNIINCVPCNDQDFDTEFLNYILSVKVVGNIEEAIEHISLHSTHHSDCIITQDDNNAQIFTALIDSAAVYVNASTRFTDGGEFGLGCEIGISTQKLHARGPMGLKELTTYKYIITGNGQIR